MDTVIKKAIDIVNKGGIIIYPTDTAFGIGCRIDDRSAVDRLFFIRKRPRTQAAPVLVASIAMALAYLDKPTNIVRRLMDQYWPGALTIVAPAKKKLVYSPIRGGGDSLGVRLPNHDVPQGIAAAIGVPILGPSANFHGHETPYRIEHVDERLVRQVDLVIPGICYVGNVSTVVDCTHTPFRILRQGAISL